MIEIVLIRLVVVTSGSSMRVCVVVMVIVVILDVVSSSRSLGFKPDPGSSLSGSVVSLSTSLFTSLKTSGKKRKEKITLTKHFHQC